MASEIHDWNNNEILVDFWSTSRIIICRMLPTWCALTIIVLQITVGLLQHFLCFQKPHTLQGLQGAKSLLVAIFARTDKGLLNELKKRPTVFHWAHCSNPEVRIRKKLQEKSEATMKMPLQRASKQAFTRYSWPLASRSLWSYDPIQMALG